MCQYNHVPGGGYPMCKEAPELFSMNLIDSCLHSQALLASRLAKMMISCDPSGYNYLLTAAGSTLLWEGKYHSVPKSFQLRAALQTINLFLEVPALALHHLQGFLSGPLSTSCRCEWGAVSLCSPISLQLGVLRVNTPGDSWLLT